MSQASIFFRLPAELRVMIYELLVIHLKDIDIRTAGACPPSITQSCCIIRHETLPIFYLQNQFRPTVRNYDHGVYKHWRNTFQPAQQLPHFPGVRMTYRRVKSGSREVARANLLEKAKDIVNEAGSPSGSVRSEQRQRKFIPLRTGHAKPDSWDRLTHFFALVSKLCDQGRTWEESKDILEIAIDGMMVCGEA